MVAKTRDAKSGEWGHLLEWQDDDDVIHQWAMPLALLQGDAAEKIVFQNSNMIESAMSVSGTLEDWQQSIGKLATGNARLVFAISAALAPTLAKFTKEDSGGFHYRGVSSCGKSTALMVLLLFGATLNLIVVYGAVQPMDLRGWQPCIMMGF